MLFLETLQIKVSFIGTSSAVTNNDSESDDNSTEVDEHTSFIKRQCIRPITSVSQKYMGKTFFNDENYQWCVKSETTRPQKNFTMGIKRSKQIVTLWQGLWKQGMWAHKIWLLFQTFMTRNFLWWYAMAMKFSTLIQHLTGYILQLTEYNILFYYWNMTCYALACSLYPYALFL